MKLRGIARTAGLLYLAFFVAGIAGSYVIRSRLFVDGDPAGTLSRLGTREGLARAEIVAELTIAAVRALTALWLYRLFRVVDSFAATSLVLLGMVNATAILGSAAMLATALDVVRDPSLGAAGSAATTVQLLYVVGGQLWRVAAVFFGLWLVPMGVLVLRSRWLPALLGRLLLVAGAGYLLSAVVDQLAAGAGTAVALLQLPSVVDELWMTAALLLVGVRSHRPATAPGPAGTWRSGPAMTAPTSPARARAGRQGRGLQRVGGFAALYAVCASLAAIPCFAVWVNYPGTVDPVENWPGWERWSDSCDPGCCWPA